MDMDTQDGDGTLADKKNMVNADADAFSVADSVDSGIMGSASDSESDHGNNDHDNGNSDESDGLPSSELEGMKGGTSTSKATSKPLWSREQFPENTKGHACWDWVNIQAAQAWSCPCEDRRNCIGADRIKPEELLIHRRDFQTSIARNEGGLRDSTRKRLAAHYNQDSKSFSRSFVVGRLNDCCAASRGLADGLSWSTWSRARTDLRKDRPFHAGR